MKLLILLTIINLFIIILIIIILNYISKKSFYDKEKNSPFECGFDPKSSSRAPFSLQFFLIAIIFLVFDVEIILLMPIVKIIENSRIPQLIFSANAFLLILFIGFFHEWKQGALKWLK